MQLQVRPTADLKSYEPFIHAHTHTYVFVSGGGRHSTVREPQSESSRVGDRHDDETQRSRCIRVPQQDGKPRPLLHPVSTCGQQVCARVLDQQTEPYSVFLSVVNFWGRQKLSVWFLNCCSPSTRSPTWTQNPESPPDPLQTLRPPPDPLQTTSMTNGRT